MTGPSREIAEIDPMALDLPFTPESAGVARQQLVRVDAHPRRRRRDQRRRPPGGQRAGRQRRAPRPTPRRRHHARRLDVAADADLDIAVTDGGALTTPERVEAGVSDLAGRGLSIVETLASRWWVESTRSRTTVHALLALA